MRSSFSIGIRSYARISILLVLATILSACAQVSVTPQPVQQPSPSLVSQAIAAEPTAPVQVAVRDFTFNSSSVSENASPLHRGADLSPEQLGGGTSHRNRSRCGRATLGASSEATKQDGPAGGASPT